MPNIQRRAVFLPQLIFLFIKTFSDFSQYIWPARVITGTHKFDRELSQILHTELHWLNVPERVMYKLCIMVHSCYTRSGAAVLGRPLPTSLRRRFSSASQVRQSTTPGPSATPVANVRPTGFLCCWPVGLELIAWQRDSSVSRDSFCKLLKLYLFTLYWNIERIRGFTRMRYTNLRTYLLTYLEYSLQMYTY